jgi:hypothetical protein
MLRERWSGRIHGYNLGHLTGGARRMQRVFYALERGAKAGVTLKWSKEQVPIESFIGRGSDRLASLE